MNVYNPKLAEMIINLVSKHGIAPELLNLELTESAYTDNPIAMSKTMAELQSHGFIIMMDDFGSGYSSLSVLKDISVNVLKIDMQFLSKTQIPGRGENIIASVIRMAKWLNIPVIAEGAETVEQVDFLRSVGCDYVQGYYFARPMPVSEYEKIYQDQLIATTIKNKKLNNYRYDDLFSSNKDMKRLFDNKSLAVVLYEFVDNHIEIIRVNNAYCSLFENNDIVMNSSDIISLVSTQHREILINAFEFCAKTHEKSECEYLHNRTIGTSIWVHISLSFISMLGDKAIIVGELADITMRKEIDFELQKYRTSLLSSDNSNSHTILIVDDSKINRNILKKILQDNFNFLEASNGEDAIEILKLNHDRIDLILLDIVMPKIDGKEFLHYKQKSPHLDGIPVIMITSDNSSQQQIATLSLGANDYIVKPFIAEVVVKRVRNVLESNLRFKEIIKEYNDMSKRVQTDLTTGLLNRVSAEVIIMRKLENATTPYAILMLDIDNFKKLNNSKGHSYGDKVLCCVAQQLKSFFKQEDVIARIGGDEFAVFLGNLSTPQLLEFKARELCNSISDMKIDGENAFITCCVGISISSKQEYSFEIMHTNADKALYNAKCHGRNSVEIYGKDFSNPLANRWIYDAENILDQINDGIYVCDKDTYELLYVNDYICKFAGVKREDCKNKKCYEILTKRTSPCEFCSLSKMSTTEVYARMFKIPNTNQIFLMRGKNINWGNSIVHLELAVDASKIDNINIYLEEGTYNGGK